MSDRDEIQEVIASYANAVDARDYDGITACFLPEATFTYEGHAFTGHAAIAGLMKGPLESVDGTQHFFTNFIIKISGDTAHLTSDSIGQHWRKGASGGETFMAGGKYNVEFRKVAGQWKISGASARGTWTQGNHSLLG
jgi:ketosteroid isomerase-like protein